MHISNVFTWFLSLLRSFFSSTVGAHTQSLDLTNGKSSPTLTLRTPPVPPALPNTASQEEVSVCSVIVGRCDEK